MSARSCDCEFLAVGDRMDASITGIGIPGVEVLAPSTEVRTPLA